MVFDCSSSVRNWPISIALPFQRIWLSTVSTSLFFSGSTVTSGGVVLGAGRSISTECVATGIVMMNMMRRTSRTSINGVMFISIIGAPSSLPPDIAIVGYSLICFAEPVDQPLGSTGFEMKPTVG